MSKKKLIVVYGDVSRHTSDKQQRLIDGRFTCGYREYGCQPNCLIVYPRPQKMSFPWEVSLPEGKGLVELCHKNPDAVVWSVKKDKRKDQLLSKVSNFKVYYSTCARSRFNKTYDVSLVDTDGRVKKDPRCSLHVKGKDPNFWKPVAEVKDFDYLIMGRRADKNEFYFIEQLNEIKEKRSILWLGGIKHKNRVKTHHNIKITPMLTPDKVRDQISRCRVGILFSEHPLEGFPQTFLEMTMCGVPVVYGGPKNSHYFHPENSILPPKKRLVVEAAEKLRISYNSIKCRQRAVDNYSIQRSIDRILSFKESKQ